MTRRSTRAARPRCMECGAADNRADDRGGGPYRRMARLPAPSTRPTPRPAASMPGASRCARGNPLHLARRCARARFDRRDPGRRRHARGASAHSARCRRRRRVVDPRCPRRGLRRLYAPLVTTRLSGTNRRGSRSPAANDPRQCRGSHDQRWNRSGFRRHRGRRHASLSTGSAPDRERANSPAAAASRFPAMAPSSSMRPPCGSIPRAMVPSPPERSMAASSPPAR